MAAKNLSAFLSKINIEERVGEVDPLIRGIAYDSRSARQDYLFCALEGLHADGHDFIDDALARGATAVVHSKPLERYREGIVYLRVANARFSLSPLSAEFFGNPSTRLPVIGVTGTDGKSTTVYLIHQLLSALGMNSGFISTVQIMAGDRAEKNPYRQSTPEASEIHALLERMEQSGKEVVVMEATSHGLSQKTNRLGDVAFRVGVLTNVSHEHLEFHGSLENYISDKANLFRALGAEGSFGVVNLDDAHNGAFRAAARVPVYGYATRSGGTELRAADIRTDAAGAGFRLVAAQGEWPARINLPGLFNIENVLAALLAVWKFTGVPVDRIVPLLPALHPTIGRMHEVDRGQPFRLVVDYAHTPGAFERLLPAMREQTKGRLITVFGSAGERDTEKRRIQGAWADRYCDIIVLTDEDPRGERSMDILEEIASGMTRRNEGPSLYLVADRREAIRTACSIAEPADTVLLLGKGHETSIIYADGPRPWDEIQAAQDCLGELGYKKAEVGR